MSYIQVELTDRQAKVLHELSVQQDLRQEKVIVQALKVYQMFILGDLIRIRKSKQCTINAVGRKTHRVVV